ncbi:MAG: molybdopterin molybdotransferase MoeA [Actinomycetota bacterium]|nr:molybdopterin molybdotransferase MoeA [Actinomycetota bacterium]
MTPLPRDSCGPGALPWHEARRHAYRSAAALPSRSLPLADARGGVLAEPLNAASPLPPFDTSAMDGFAVAGQAPWRVVGQRLAGTDSGRTPLPGEAVEIATGAVVPAGVDAVLPYEQASVDLDYLTGQVEPGRHIRRGGEECRAGDELLPPGTPVTSAVLGLAAAVGLDELWVIPRPRVALLVTGDELLQSGLPRGGRIRDAVGPLVPGLVEGYGGTVVSVRHIPDVRGALVEAVEQAVADIVVTSGASSVGPADHLPAVLKELAAEPVVDGVLCRPGRPQTLALLPDGRWLMGLPGNPLAAVAGVITCLASVLAATSGRPLPSLRPVRLPPSVQPRPGTTRLITARLVGDEAEPTGYGGAAMLRGLARSDVIVALPPHGEGVPEALALPLV